MGSFCLGGAAQPTPCSCPAACSSISTPADPLALTWSVTTYAGNGSGWVGDATFGTASSFLKPWTIAVDNTTGTVFVVDSDAHVIRAVGAPPAAAVTTLAGRANTPGFADGVGSSALFNLPQAVAVTSTGGLLYVSDFMNNRIRSVNVASRVVATLAGTGSGGADINGAATTVAVLALPLGVAVDGNVVFFVNNFVVRAVAAGAVVPVAGRSGVAGFADGIGTNALFAGPWGLAAAGGQVYVCDNANSLVRVVAASTGAVSTLLGAPAVGGAMFGGAGWAAALALPTAVAVLSSGALVVSERAFGQRLRLVSPSTGASALVAGSLSGASGFLDGNGSVVLMDNPWGVAAAGGGRLLFCDSLNRVVRVARCDACPVGSYCAAGAAAPCPPGTFGGAAGLASPACSGPCSAAPGFACAGGATSAAGTPCPVGCFCPGGASPPIPCTCPAACASPGVAADPWQGLVWASATVAGSGTGAYAEGVGTGASFLKPWNLVFDASAGTNALYVVELLTSVIRRVNTTTGSTALFAGTPAVPGFADGAANAAKFSTVLGGLAVDAARGLLIVADNTRVRSVTLRGGAPTVATLAGSAVSADVDGPGGTFLSSLVGVAVGPASTIYAVSWPSHKVRAVAPSGALFTLAGTGAAGYANGVGLAAAFNRVYGVAVSGDASALVLTDQVNNRLRTIALSPAAAAATVAALAGSGVSGGVDGRGTSASFSLPTGIASLASGAFVVGDLTGNRLRLVVRGSASAQVATIAGAPSGAAGFAEGFGTDVLLNSPVGVTGDGNGSLFVADSENFRVRRLTCAACPRGSYCVQGKPYPCPAGFFGGSAGLASAGACSSCAAAPGSHCPAGSVAAAGVPCPRGHFCAGGAAPAAPCTCPALCPTAGGSSADPGAQWTAATVAGGGLVGGNANGVGTNALFKGIRNMVVVGNTAYGPDDGNHVIRALDIGNLGAVGVTTFAGSGAAAWADGTGAAAAFNRPMGLCAPTSGAVMYLADLSNHRMRAIALPGAAVTTLAGSGAASAVNGAGTAATFNQPNGCAVDGGGATVWVAEVGNNAIRQIVVATAAVTTLATGLSNPTTLSLYQHSGGAATLIFSQRTGHRVSALAVASGAVSSVVGTGVAGTADCPPGAPSSCAAQVHFPDGVAVWDSSALAFIVSSGTNTGTTGTVRNVKAVNLVTGAVVTLLGATAAGTYSNPTDGIGFNARFSAPYGILVLPNASTSLPNTLLVTDGVAQSVVVITCAACPRGSFCAPGGQLGLPLPCPAGVFGGATGLASAACSGPCAAAPGWACGGGATSAAGAPCPRGFWCPGGAAAPLPCGCASACGGGAAADPSAGAPCAALQCTTTPFVGNGAINNAVADGFGTAAGFAQPRGLKIAPNGDAFVTQDNYPATTFTRADVRVVTPAGAVTTLAGGTGGNANGIGTAAMFNRPLDVSVDDAGNAYVCDLMNHAVRLVTPAGAVSHFAGSSAGLSGWVDGRGTTARFNMPARIAYLPSPPTLFVADMTANVVRRVGISSRLVTTLAGYGTVPGTLLAPVQALTTALGGVFGLALSPDGATLYVIERASRCVRAINLPSGSTVPFAGSCGAAAAWTDGMGAAARFDTPESISVDANGTLWVADTPNLMGGRLRTISPTGLVTTVAAARQFLPGAPNTTFLSMANFQVASWRPNMVGLVAENGLTSGPGGVSILSCVACPAGAWCAGGVTTPCAAGTFSNATGQASAAACLPCAAAPGFACGANSILPGGAPCPAGYACPGGAAPPQLCLCAGACPVAGLAAPIAGCGVSCNVSILTGAPGWGNNPAGANGGVNGAPSVARLRKPRVAARVPGGLFFCEDGVSSAVSYASGSAVPPFGNAVRFVAFPSGVVSAVAGSPSGTAGFANGVGAAAQFSRPLGIACTAASFCFVADLANNRVRSVSPAGAVATLSGSGVAGTADGVGVAATHNAPHALTVDPAGVTVYVTDSGGRKIRRIVVATAAVTTLAGTGVAGALDGPALSATFNGPKGLLVTPDGGTLYVCDAGARLLRAISLQPPGGEVVRTIVGSAAAMSTADGLATAVGLGALEMVALDGSGAFWIADNFAAGGPGLLRRAESTAAGLYVTTVAGGGGMVLLPGLQSAIGFATSVEIIASAANSTMLSLVDNTGNAILSTTCSACPVGAYCAGGATLPCPAGTFGNASGLVTAACSGPCASPPGWGCGAGSTSAAGAPCPPGFFCPGAAAPPTPCACPAACSAGGLAYEPPNAGWSVTTVAGTGLAGVSPSLNAPSGLSVVGASLLVTEFLGNTIRALPLGGPFPSAAPVFAGTGAAVTADGAPPSFSGPAGVAPWLLPPTADGLALVMDTSGSALRGVYANGSAVTLLRTLPAPYPALTNPCGVAQDDTTGTIYIGNQAGHTVVALPADGRNFAFVIAGVSGTQGFVNGQGFSARFRFPNGVAVSPAAPPFTPLTIFVADSSNNVVRAISGSGVVSTLAGSAAGAAGFSDGVGTASLFNAPKALALGATRRELFVAEGGGHALRVIYLDSAAVRTLAGLGVPAFADGPALLAAFNSLNGVAVANASTIFVGDTSGNRVRALSCGAPPSRPLGFFFSAAAGGPLPCPPGTFGAAANLTSAACSGPCAAPPGWGCGLASTNVSGAPCPAGYACPGGAAPPAPCACPDTCPAGTASATPLGAAAWAVSTLAVLPLATAAFPPRALALGDAGSGAAYAADDGGARIWQVALATGAVAALSGSGTAGYADGAAASAQYNRPLSLAFSAPASLFVADFSNNRVRVVALPAGTASTAAGSGAAGSADAVGTTASFNGPVALAVDPSATFLFVAEFFGCLVRRVAVAGFAVVTLAGAPAVCAYADGAGAVARFGLMASIAVLGNGMLAVADRDNNRRVRLLSNVTNAAGASDVAVSTLVGWGSSAAGAAWADGPAAPAPFAAVGFPEGVAGADGGGTLFFTEKRSLAPPDSAGRVRRVALAGPLAAAPSVSTVVGPRTSAPLPGGDFDALGGAAAYLGGPAALLNAGNGTLLTLTSAGALKVLRCEVCPQGSWCANGAPRPCPAGSYGAARGLGAASACSPCAAAPGWACAPGGTSPGGAPCPPGTYCPGGAVPAQPCACAAACAAGGLASDPLAGGPSPAWLFSIASGSGAAAVVDGPSATGAAAHGAPAGLSLSARTGTLYVADYTGHAIRTVVGGVTATLAGTGAPGAVDGVGTSASFFNPVGLALAEANGTLFVGDFTNNLIRAVNVATAAVTTLAGSGNASSVDGVGVAASLNGPSGLALDAASGVLYVAEQSACAVRAIVLASGAVTRLAGWGGTCAGAFASGGPLWATNFSMPTGLAFNPIQKVLFVNDFLSSRVVALDVAGGGSTVVAGGGAAGGADGLGTAAGFGNPIGVALDAAGTLLFVADFGVNRLRRISLGSAGNPSNVSTVGSLACPSCPSAWNPYHVAAAGNGTLFFSDHTHNRVLSVTCGSPCFMGYYCAGGAPPAPCPPGTYGASVVLTAASACTPCAAAPGWGCGAGSTTAAGAPCPSGYRCVGGAAPPALCTCPGACTTTLAASPVLLADARADYRATAFGLSTASFTNGTGITDAQGTGRWNYFNRAGYAPLTFGVAGNAGKAMYGAAGQANQLPAIGDAQIFSNVPAPPPGKLSLHVGATSPQAAVLRWTAGTTIFNLSVSGSFKKTIFVATGAKFDIFVNGSNRFSVGTTALDTLAPQPFSVSGTGIAAGQHVEFVFSTTSGSNAGMIGDLQATIWGSGYLFYSPPVGAAPPAAGALWTATTLLGGGSASNLDGLGRAAALRGPSSVTRGPDGALYVTEYAGQRLRRLDPLGAPWGAPGTVASSTTVAGALVATSGFANGSGEAVRFTGPTSVTFSATGMLFVTEGVNAAVRAMLPPFCAVTTALNLVAGVPNVLLPDGGGTGGLGPSTAYLLFQTSCRVALVNLTTFSLDRSLAGGGTSGTACGFADGVGTNALFSAPSSLVQDGASGSFSRLLVADNLNHLVRALAPATGAVTTLLGSGVAATIDGTGTSASLNGPRGLALDGQGFLFIAEFSGHAIRRAELATGLVATIAGVGGGALGFANGFGAAVAFANPFGISTLSPGLLLVADYSNNQVRALTCAPCPLGSYCGANAAAPTPCPGGTYGATSWLPAASACSPCAAAPGWGCLPGSTNASGVVCPAGFFCAGGAASPKPCTCPSACPTLGTLADPLALVWASGFVAGSGTAGSSDGAGTAALLTQPWALGLSPSGDALCVPDLATHRLRLINLTTLAVTTLAGSGTAASGDGVGAGASFNGPDGCTWGPNGTILLSEGGGNRLRAVEVATGAVSTLAAGAGAPGAADGAGASFSTPVVGAFLGPVLYFVDFGGHTVRTVAPTGFVTTVAGLGGVAGYAGGVGSAARFNSPFGVVVDGGTGMAYVTDFNNHAVRAVSPGGTVATLAGNGSAGGADGAYAVARFTNPAGIAFAPSGSLVVADFGVGGDRIRLVSTATGAVVTLAGSGSRGLADATGVDVWMNAPVGVAVVQATGRVLFSSSAAVRSLTCAPCAKGFWCASGRAFACPAGTYSCALNAGAPAACLPCAANQGWGCTPASTSAAGAPCPAGYWCAGGAAPPALCTCAAACAGGAKWEVPGAAVTVGTVAGTGAAGALNGPALSATFQGPRTVVVNPGNGDMYISDWTVVRKLSGGAVSTLATGFNSPCGACMASSNDILYVADSGSNKLLAVTVATGVVSPAAGAGAPGAVNGPATSVALLNGPVDCALGVNGVVYIADKINHMIRTLAGGVVATLLGAGVAGYRDGAGVYALLNQPWGLALSRDNATLYVVESAGNRVRSVALGAPGPVVSTLAGSGAAAFSNGIGPQAAFSGPVSLLVGPRSGVLYVTDSANNRVRRIDPFSGNVSTLTGTATGGLVNGPAASAQFNFPIGMQASADESVLFLAQSFLPALRSVVCLPLTATPAASASALRSPSGAPSPTPGLPSGSSSASAPPTASAPTRSGGASPSPSPLFPSGSASADSTPPPTASQAASAPPTGTVSQLASATATPTGTVSQSASATGSAMMTATATSSGSPSATLSPSALSTQTVSQSAASTATATRSLDPSASGASTDSGTASGTGSQSAPPTTAATQSAPATEAATASAAATASGAASASSLATATSTQTGTLSAADTATATRSFVPGASGASTDSGTAFETGSQSGAATASALVSGSAPPLATGAQSAADSGTATASCTQPGAAPAPPTATETPTGAATETATQTGLGSAPAAGASTQTATASSAATATASSTTTATPTASLTRGATASSSGSGSVSATPTPTQSPTGSGTATSTPSTTASGSTTLSASPTASLTAGASSSNTGSSSLSNSATASPTGTGTPTATPTGTGTGTAPNTPSSTVSGSSTVSASPTPSLTLGASASNTGSTSLSGSTTPSATATSTPTGTATGTGTSTPAPTPSPTTSASSTVSASPTAPLSPGASPSATGSNSWSATATASQTPSGTATGTPTASGTGTPAPTPTSTVSGSSTATQSRTASLTAGASASVTPPPSDSASATGTVSPTATPSATATATPSGTGPDTPSSTRSSSTTMSASPTAPLSRGASASHSGSAPQSGPATPTASPSPTGSGTGSGTASPSGASTPTPSPTPSGTVSGSLTPPLSPGASPSATPSAPPTPTVSGSGTGSPTGSGTGSGTGTPTATLSRGASPSPTPPPQTPTDSASASGSVSASAQPSGVVGAGAAAASSIVELGGGSFFWASLAAAVIVGGVAFAWRWAVGRKRRMQRVALMARHAGTVVRRRAGGFESDNPLRAAHRK